MSQIHSSFSRQATPFQKSVWDALSVVTAGRLTTYKHISIAIGRPGSAQAVHNAVKVGVRDHKLKLPWHRVVRADGRMYLNPRHSQSRIDTLRSESIEVTDNGRITNLTTYLYDYEQ